MQKIDSIPNRISELLSGFATFDGQWWHTKDYSKFEYIGDNRKDDHWRGIADSIERTGLGIHPADVAFVENQFVLLDGQGRRKACAFLGLPYYFVFHNEVKTLDDAVDFISKIAGFQKAFTIDDFAHLYSKNNDVYEKFEEMREFSFVEGAHPEKMKANDMLALLCGCLSSGRFYTGNRSIMNDFKSNRIQFSNADFKRAKDVISNLKIIAPHLKCWTKSSFITAMSRIMKRNGFDIKILEHSVSGVRGKGHILGGRNQHAPRTVSEYGKAICLAYNLSCKDGEHITDINFEAEAAVEKKSVRQKRYEDTKSK